MPTNIPAIVQLACKTVVQNNIQACGMQHIEQLRRSCSVLVIDYKVEDLNAALNDLLKEGKIVQSATNWYDLVKVAE